MSTGSTGPPPFSAEVVGNSTLDNHQGDVVGLGTAGREGSHRGQDRFLEARGRATGVLANHREQGLLAEHRLRLRILGVRFEILFTINVLCILREIIPA